MRRTFRKQYALGAAALALGLISAPASAWCDFITGGGFGTTKADVSPVPQLYPAMKNFGAHGGCKNGSFWGHVNYIDHYYSPTGHFRSLIITAYQRIGTDGGRGDRDPKRTGKRRICGTGEIINPTPHSVYFRVEMTDNGEGTREPRDPDEFEIWLRGVPPDNLFYHAFFTLEGGNIQLHKPNPKAPETFPEGECKA